MKFPETMTQCRNQLLIQKERIMENEDKLKKINNVILYNVAESDNDSTAERNADDMSFCGELMEKVLKVGYEVGDIVKVIRLNMTTNSRGRYWLNLQMDMLRMWL